MERIITPNEAVYENFETVTEMLNLYSKAHMSNTRYFLADVYLDFGQKWMWTTICNNKETQILCPRDWKSIFNAKSFEELEEVFNTITTGKFFSL